MNPNIPEKCNGCGKELLLENLYVDDGCPCNTPRGINFKPSNCALCKADNCVKPGHRLSKLFGDSIVENKSIKFLKGLMSELGINSEDLK